MTGGVSDSSKFSEMRSPTKETRAVTSLSACANVPNVEKSSDIHGLETNEADDHSSLVRSRVERLSICENSESKNEIIGKLVDPKISSAEELADIENLSGSKRRRRRSSAVQTSSLDGLKSANSSTSSLAVPKKKKRSSKPVNLTINKLEKPLSIKDLRDLILFAFHDTNNSPKWVQIENRASLKKVVVLFAPGLLPKDLNPAHLPNTDSIDHFEELRVSSSIPTQLFGISEATWYATPVCAPGSKNSLFSAYNSFVNVGLSKKEKEEKKKLLSKRKIVINDLLLNIDDMIENDYPIHHESPGITDEYKQALRKQRLSPDEITWIETSSFDHEGSHIFALDCEMCMSEDGLVLTRCSIVDFQGLLIYDEFVKPAVPIIDYLTKYSGITPEKLENVKTTLIDVQKDILRMVSADDILIGHSLQSDLNVLKLRHPKIVDTALIYEHKAGPPFKPSLRYLASEYLHIDIQKDTGLGHDSYEDAKACMELTKLKISNGLAFGMGINTENLFHRLARNGIKSMILNDSAPKQSSILKGDSNEIKVRCSDDDKIIDTICENINDYNFFVGRLREMEFARDFTRPHNPNVKICDEEISFKNLSARIEKLYDRLPPSTLMLLCSGTGDTRDWLGIMSDLNKLNKEERASEKMRRESEIQKSVVKARDAVSFLTVKPGKPLNSAEILDQSVEVKDPLT